MEVMQVMSSMYRMMSSIDGVGDWMLKDGMRDRCSSTAR